MLTESFQTVFFRINQFFGGQTPPDKRNRSRAGLLLTMVSIPLLLGVLACFDLPVPVGDPEKSRIDPALTGIWIGNMGDDESTIMVLDPYDKRTWLLSLIELDTGQDAEPAEESEAGDIEPERATSPIHLLDPADENPVKIRAVALFKAWLTKIKGTTFITWESKNLADTLPDMVPEGWWVYRVRQSDEGILYLDIVNNEVDDLDEVKTRRQAEKIIRRHVNDPEFFETFMELRKLPESDYERVSKLLEDFGISF